MFSMSTWKFPLSTNTGIALSSTDNLYVAEGILIGTQSAAISGSGANQIVEVYGTVISALEGITLGTLADGNSVSVYVGATGHVITTYDSSPGASAIVLNGGGGTVVNDGEIRSTGYGVFFNAGSLAGVNTLENNGTITGVSGVEARGGALTGMHLINTGTITGSEESFGEIASQNVATSSKDTITNSGLMQGNIFLNAGDDSYDGRLGTVKGTVFGGDGADKILCGVENNVIDGGAGIDTLFGGIGADSLTGGTDADTFLFKVVGDSTVAAKGRDTIIDFSSAELDKIDLHYIDANSSKSGNQRFHFIGTDTFDHVAGELRFKQAGGDTFVLGDVNGDGKADFQIRLDASVTLAATDFAL
jgi:Ca2+-binding RTX toxin-like protein